MWHRMRNLPAVLVLAAAVAMLAANAAMGQIDGELILDNAEIPSCAPISGVIEMQVQQDTEIPGTDWYAFHFGRGGYSIIVATPRDSTVVVDWPHVADGLNVCYGPLMGSTTLSRDKTYAFPVFLMKTGRGFIFDSPGDYRISYRFALLPGQPAFTTTVRVAEGDSRDRQAFVSAFSPYAVVIEPFDDAAPLEPIPQFDPQSPYCEALQIAEANMLASSLLAGGLLHGQSADLVNDRLASWLTNEMNTKKIVRGVALDSVLVHHRDIWHVMKMRQMALRGDAGGSWVEPLDGQGRIIISSP